MKAFSLKTGLAALALLSASLPCSALEGAVLIANDSVPLAAISPDALKDIYTAKTTYWDGGQTIVIVILPDKTDAALKDASGMEPGQFKTFWQRLVFSGRGKQPQKAADTAALVAAVASTKGAIALAPADADLTGVKKLEIK